MLITNTDLLTSAAIILALLKFILILYFSLEIIKFNVQILRNIDKHTTQSSPDMMKMYT